MGSLHIDCCDILDGVSVLLGAQYGLFERPPTGVVIIAHHAARPVPAPRSEEAIRAFL